VTKFFKLARQLLVFRLDPTRELLRPDRTWGLPGKSSWESKISQTEEDDREDERVLS